ncbi:MAG: MarR family transcriptional regulator [Sphingobacteriales bacterium]|nr:MarR family transcriptional regulator [Sphingobacteriales bacterium]
MLKQNEPLIHLLMQLSKKYMSVFSEITQDIPLERYHYVLVLVDKHRETLSQKALAEILQVDKSFMVNMINYLTENGFVYREINSDDRRQQFIKLTPKAKEHLPHIHQSFKELNQKAFNNLSPEKINTFFEIINTLQNNLTRISNHEINLDFQRRKNNL